MASFLSKHVEPLSLLKKGFKFTIGLLLIAVGFTLYLIVTPQGLKTTLHLISDFSPYKIQFTQVDGALISHAHLKDFQLHGPNLIVKASELDIGWQLATLLKKERTLEYIKATQLTLWSQNLDNPFDNKATKISFNSVQKTLSKSIPIPIKVENIHIQQATIHWGEYEHFFSEFIVKSASSELAKIEEIHYQGAWGKFHAYLQKGIKIDWDLRLTKNPYLVEYHSHEITTQGNLFLPSGQLEDSRNQINVKVQAKAFSFAEHHLQNITLDLKGTLTAHQASMTAHYNQTPLQMKLSGEFSPKHWQGKIEQLEIKHKRWEKIGKTTGNVNIDWQEKTIFSVMELLLGEQYPVNVKINVEKRHPYSLSGSVQTHLNNVKTLSSLVPALENLRGKLDVDLKLTGSLLQPQWTGQLVLKEAKMRASSLGSKAMLNQLQLTFLENHKMSISGDGIWGSGPFTLEGNGDFLTSSPSMIVKLKGENLLLSDSPEYYIIANPDLTLSLKNGSSLLEGKIFIPQAEIKSLKNPDTIAPSQDVVIISNKKTSVSKPLAERTFATQITTNIDLILSDKIIYKGHGFSTRVDGRLQVKQQPGQPPTANGKLIFHDGKYRAYGKTFDIAYGQIIFSGGPIYDPILDIRAQRKIQAPSTLAALQDTQPKIVGIKFGGNLKTPKIDFYSSPANLSDADIISYLVVGRPQHQVNEAQAELLFEAVSQLANVMGNSRKDVRFDLAEQLKLDQIGFSKKPNHISTPGHNPLEDTVFVLGKQLSDRLYMNYSVGIVDSASQFGLRYLLGKNVTIEAAAGTQASSADVVVSFEGH